MEHSLFRLVAMQQLREGKLRVTSWHGTQADAEIKAKWIVKNGGSIESLSEWKQSQWLSCQGESNV